MKRASERFKIGDRIRLSDDGRETHREMAARNTKAVVVAFVRTDGWKMRIRTDGSSTARSVVARYWEIDPDAAQDHASSAERP